MARRRMLDTFEAAKSAGPYDEYPVLEAGIDPQLHLSRNDRPQPFYLTCAKDSLLVQMSGIARVDMRDTTVLSFKLVPGDYAYVPAGTPHRIVPQETSIQYRYKAEQAGLEAASFYCDGCGELLFKETWDTAEEGPQAAYARVVESFNGDADLRGCVMCGAEAGTIDLTDFRWREIADELSQDVGETEAAW